MEISVLYFNGGTTDGDDVGRLSRSFNENIFCNPMDVLVVRASLQFSDV